MPKVAKITIVSECGSILAALKGPLANVPTFMLEGKTYTRQQLIGIFQSAIDATTRTGLAHAAFTEAVIAAKKVYADVRVVRNAFKHAMESTYGKASLLVDTLKLGTKAKPRKPTVETKAAAIEKRKATRQARGTMGKKQRLKIKGKV